MSVSSDLEIERILLELDQMCDTFERRGWIGQAAAAEQLYVNIHRQIGKPVPRGRSERLMRELATVAPLIRRA